MDVSQLVDRGVMVDQSLEALEKVGNSGLLHCQRTPVVIFKPSSSDQLPEIIAFCRQQGLPLYPISAGKNWGYGTAAPVRNDCALLDLSALNRIIHVDEELGVAEIEPGVTQRQLADRLRDTAWLLDCTAAGPETSVLGNVLERGFGYSRWGLRSRHFTIVEAYTADGCKVQLDASERYVGRAGLSSGLHELFTQNNLAIVTRMRFELTLRTEASLRCIVRLRSESHLAEYIDVMRELRAEGTVDTMPHMGNRFRMLIALEQFRFHEWDVEQGATMQQVEPLLRKHGLSTWTSIFVLAGAPGVAKARAKRAKQRLRGIARVTVISLSTLGRVNRALQSLPHWLSGIARIGQLKNMFSNVTTAMHALEGEPSGMALKGCYWRHASRAPTSEGDPVQNGCGFYWLAPALPLCGSVVEECIRVTQAVFDESGFELAATLTAASPQLCQGIISLHYNTEDDAESQRAYATIQRLRELYREQGWLCYRRAIDEMPFSAQEREQGALDLRRKIKEALDPDQLIAPGRYQG